MRRLALAARTRRVFDRIRSAEFPLSVLGRSHARVMPMTGATVNRRLSLARLSAPAVNQYRRAVAEMVRAFRTATGEPLVKALGIAVRKWSNLGLDHSLLQELACDIFDKFEAAGRLPPKREDVVPPKPAPRKRRRTYRQAVERGWATRGAALTPAEQVAVFHRGVAQNRDISRRLAALLKARGITGRQFVNYNAFAQKLGRLSRNYSSRSLARAAADLVDLYEARSLDRSALLAIAATLFSLTDLPS